MDFPPLSKVQLNAMKRTIATETAEIVEEIRECRYELREIKDTLTRLFDAIMSKLDPDPDYDEPEI